MNLLTSVPRRIVVFFAPLPHELLGNFGERSFPLSAQKLHFTVRLLWQSENRMETVDPLRCKLRQICRWLLRDRGRNTARDPTHALVPHHHPPK